MADTSAATNRRSMGESRTSQSVGDGIAGSVLAASAFNGRYPSPLSGIAEHPRIRRGPAGGLAREAPTRIHRSQAGPRTIGRHRLLTRGREIVVESSRPPVLINGGCPMFAVSADATQKDQERAQERPATLDPRGDAAAALTHACSLSCRTGLIPSPSGA